MSAASAQAVIQPPCVTKQVIIRLMVTRTKQHLGDASDYQIRSTISDTFPYKLTVEAEHLEASPLCLEGWAFYL